MTVEDIFCWIWNKRGAQRRLVFTGEALEGLKSEEFWPTLLGCRSGRCWGSSLGCFYKAQRWADLMEAVASDQISHGDLIKFTGEDQQVRPDDGSGRRDFPQTAGSTSTHICARRANGFTHLSRVGWDTHGWPLHHCRSLSNQYHGNGPITRL